MIDNFSLRPKSDLESYIVDLQYDVSEFNRILSDIWDFFDFKTFTESKIPDIEKQAIWLLKDLRLSNTRIAGDVRNIENCIASNQQYSKIQTAMSNSNLKDLALQCDQILQRYNKFVRKDVDKLKEELNVFVNSIKKLDQLLHNYNKQSTYKLIDFSHSYEFLNKVVNFGFDITSPIIMSLKEFKDKYSEVIDSKFVEYLKFLKDPLTVRTEAKWLQLLEKYSNTFDKD